MQKKERRSIPLCNQNQRATHSNLLIMRWCSRFAERPILLLVESQVDPHFAEKEGEQEVQPVVEPYCLLLADVCWLVLITIIIIIGLFVIPSSGNNISLECVLVDSERFLLCDNELVTNTG